MKKISLSELLGTKKAKPAMKPTFKKKSAMVMEEPPEMEDEMEGEMEDGMETEEEGGDKLQMLYEKAGQLGELAQEVQSLAEECMNKEV